jgi:predicted AAA+ superfamily ATPase
LFLDDLSFNKDDVRYRGLKALLEGSVEPLPSNVILVATSNRRHLVPETFAEREGGVRSEGEIHEVDAVEEKLSLSDRFGLVVSFYSPDQATYLAIVRHLASRAGLHVPIPELESGAVLWALQNNGRSGRAAAQYIRHLSQGPS